MKIVPINVPGDHRTGGLRRVDQFQISKTLGFAPNIEEDPHEIECSWGFTADGVECGIWGYKGRTGYGLFSTFGPRHVFVELFGEECVTG